MSTFNMFKLTQRFSSLKLNVPSCQPQRNYKAKLNELGLPEKPKKPRTSFFLFKQEVRSSIIKMNPSMNEADVSREAGLRWNKLSKEEKDTYTKKYNQEKARYTQDLLRYQNSLTEDQKLQIAETVKNMEKRKDKIRKKRLFSEFNKPKRPLSAFIKYCMSVHKPGTSFLEASKSAAIMWNALPQSTKQKFLDDYDEEKKKYRKAMEEWEQKMIELGHIDLVREKTLKEKGV